MLSGSLVSGKAVFCIETCRTPQNVGTSDAGAAQTAIETAWVFYNYIVRYKPLGLPTGAARNALWPLLSTRLAQELESLEACEDDYYARYGEILKKNQYKPDTPWLEDGLFSGPDEAANPAKFTILGSQAVGANRFEIHLKFTFVETACPDSRPCEHWDYEGVVTVAEERGRFVIDDFLSMYANYNFTRLWDGYKQCKDGNWVGDHPIVDPATH